MKDIPKQSVLLITKCCNKGFYDAQALIKRLNEEGCVYNFHMGRPNNCSHILERMGCTLENAKLKPHIYIEDILFPVESLQDARFTEELVLNIIKINAENKRRENEANEDKQKEEGI